MRKYLCLSKKVFEKGDYKIVPLRDEDKYLILQWRNEQIFHLRQKEPLTKEKQELYFENVVAKLFETQQPNQILFSYLKNDICIGYGGLVHIDWEGKNAEISFITETNRNDNGKIFDKDFRTYISLVKEVSHKYLDFHKVHSMFYDIPERQEYWRIIKELNFIQEAKLSEHILIRGELKDTYIYSHFKKEYL